MTIDGLLADLVQREGGYVNHPDDHGGPTNHGITLQTLKEWRYPQPVRREDVRVLGSDEAKAIYRRVFVEAPGFAEAIGNERLLALVVDWGVHSGPGRAIKGLQRALGVTDDGIIGRLTRQILVTESDSLDLYRKVLAGRLKALYRLAVEDPTQRVFVDGWFNRVVAFL